MRSYDLVVGVGGTCRCSMGLREAKLQLLSFPQDWNPGGGLVSKCETIVAGFSKWLDRDALVLQNPEEKENHLVYKNTKTGYTFLHDFHAKQTFDEQYPVVYRKYERRIARLMGLIDRARKILIVWVNVPNDEYATPDTARDGQSKLSERWPDKRFDILVLNHQEGVRWTQANISDESDGVQIASFDYKDRSPGEDTWMADQYILGKWFKREYRVVDYRTSEEIAVWKKKEKNYEYDRWCAKNVYQWLRNKLEYKIYVHLRKQLKKRGLI